MRTYKEVLLEIIKDKSGKDSYQKVKASCARTLLKSKRKITYDDWWEFNRMVSEKILGRKVK